MAVGEITPATTAEWLSRFEARAGQHRDVVAVSARPGPALRDDLGPSIATFQLGESGTGEHLLAAARRAGADPAYVDSLGHFVAEEQEHARLLELVLSDLGVPLRTRHWSDRVFVLVRRLHSLRTEVLVLLVAEVIALTYYSSLRDGIDDPALHEIFARIHDDEIVHVEFHCQTLPRHLERFPGPIHRCARLLWKLLVTGASIAVAIDHRHLLRRVGVTRRSFLKRVRTDRRQIETRLFGQTTHSWRPRPPEYPPTRTWSAEPK
ncbi:MAG: ferritin-like domain-containing protein [Acidimicrobiia bacterium]|nr:ferritin-like domain-containing protein [Acidimicrobiia bacterium]